MRAEPERLDEPAEGARVRAVLALSGQAAPGTAAICVERARGGSVRLALGDAARFSARLPLAAHERGPTEIAVWALDGDGARRLLARRRVYIEAPEARRLTALATAALGKAWRAAREGRLPASPRAWLRLWRAHVAERGAAEAESAALAPARARASADAAARLARLMAATERVTLPSATPPALSVIVVSYNRPELLLAALLSVAEAHDAATLAEVIIVDNASAAPTQALLARLDGARVLRRADNAGFLLAVNEAAALARGEFLMLLNSDARLAPESLRAALAAARRPGVGVVGGRLVHPNGRLQEAGVVVFSDGGVGALGRGAPADDAAWDVRREVDAVSGALLVTPAALFSALGGFDARYRPAYYEDIDYCLRVRARGLGVVVDPDVVATHHELASAGSPAEALAAQAARRPIFFAAHRDTLRAQPAPTPTPRWRPRAGRRALLFVDDRLPLARYGAGHPRAAACVRLLAEAGHAVTAYATLFPEADAAVGRDELPRDVERAGTGGVDALAAFLAARAGDFDALWVSRAHNVAHVTRAARGAPLPPLLYDVEAWHGGADELQAARAAHAVVAVSVSDAAAIVAAGLPPPRVVGHALAPAPTARDFAARAGLLFVGAFHEDGAPNVAAAERLARAVFPRVRARLGDVRLTLAGARPTARVLALAGEHVAVYGSPPELRALYDEARVLVAPLSQGAGLPWKLHEAAALGLPTVTTPLLARLTGWRDGVELLVADDDDDALADAVARLYGDAALWQALRDAALARVTADNGIDAARASLAAIVGGLPGRV